MTTRIYTITALIASLWLITSSCSQDLEPILPVDSESVSVTVQASRSTTEPGSSTEDSVSTLRLIVFRSEMQGLAKPVIFNEIHNGAGPFTLKILEGPVQLVLIANELASWKLSEIISAQQLTSKLFNTTTVSTLKSPFTMYASADKTISATQKDFTLALERTHVKVSLNINCDFNVLGIPITLYAAGITSLPLHSYLVPQTYMSTNYFNSANTLLEGANKDVIYTSSGFTTKAGGIIFYIPEKIANTTNNYSCVDIVAFPNTNRDDLVHYTIVLGNGMDKLYGPIPVPLASLTAADLSLRRNTHYKISASIMSFKNSQILISPTVLGWTLEEDVNGELTGPPYLNVAQINQTITKDKTYRIYFWTNQKYVLLQESGTKLPNTPINISNLFEGLPLGANLSFNAVSGSGYIDLKLKATTIPASAVGDQFRIYLTAGNLRRGITIQYQN